MAVLAGGTALGQAVVIATSPILTRLYLPEDFGVLGVYISLLGVLGVLVTFRYALAIPLPERDEDAAALVVLCLAIIPITAAVTGLVGWGFGTQIARWTNTPILASYMWLLPVGMGFLGIYQVFCNWAVRKKAFARVARTKFSQAIAGVVAQLSLFGLGPLGLLIGQVFAGAAGGGTLATMASREDGLALRATDRRAVTRMAVRYRRFPQISVLSGLAGCGGLHIPLLLFTTFFGASVAGQFGLVHRAAGAPMYLIGQAVAMVFLGEGVTKLRESKASLRRLFLAVTARMASFVILPVGILVLFGSSLFPLVFGENWHTAGQFACLLAPALGIQYVVAPLATTLNMLDLQSWQFVWDWFLLLFVNLSILLAVFLKWSAFATIAVYSSTMIIGYVLLWVIILVALSKKGRKFESA